jgi:hypothetical protein
MAYGLRVINDDSQLLIDSEYVNPTFVRKIEFNSTAVREEAGSFYLHRNYILREYNTTSISAPGNYIVLWTIPENISSGVHKDVWYSFPSSTSSGSISFSCYVLAGSLGSPLTYSLPTGYVFAVDSAAISALSSTGPALRMFNSANGKTFDSNLTQLVPYDFSDNVTIPLASGGQSQTTLDSIPTNPIFLIPTSDLLTLINTRVYFPNSSGHIESVYNTSFRRVGSTVYFSGDTVYSNQKVATLAQDYNVFVSGSSNNLSLMVADANFYQAPASSGGGGTNPTYTLSSNFSTVNEGATFVVTLTTTLTANGTIFPFTVTGISANDLTVGGLTGNFVIQNNTATATFTVSNDLSLEGNESFTLSLEGTTLSVSVSILDTSKPAGVYSFGAVSPVDEGTTTGYVNFEYQYAAGKVVTFAIVAPTSGTAATSADVTLNYLAAPGLVINQSNNGAGTFPVGYDVVADSTTEGPEYFRISATVDGTTYYSGNIQINDTSLTAVSYGITANNNWLESSTGNIANITATGVNGTTLYFTTDNSLVVPQTASATVNSNNYNINVSYNVGFVTSTTSVTLQVRTGSASGSVVADKVVSIVNAAPSYSFGAVSGINEGSSGSVQFNYSNSAGVSFGFSATSPSFGDQSDGSGDVTVNTTSFTVGNTDAAGTVSVSYSVAADGQTEGPQYFRIQAYVNGVYYTSDNILINDTSQAPVYPPAGSNNGGQYCIGTTLYQNKNDGSGGVYATVVETNSPTCGYVAPSYSLGGTFSSLNNGATTSFYLQVTNPPAGDTVYVSVSGAGAARVTTISPTQFTTNTGTTIYYIYIGTSTPTSSVAAQSVTVNVAHNNGSITKSFSFTIPEYNVAAAAPTVTSVEITQAVYYAGETVEAIINFSGIITADTYINIRINAGGFGTLYYPSISGAAQSYTSGQYGDYIIMTVGTYSAYYVGPVNPGGFFPPQTGCRLSAKAVTAGGSDRQGYVQSNLFTLDGGSSDR